MNYKTLHKCCNRMQTNIQKAEMALGTICMAVMLVMMLVNIFFRYVLSKPIFYADELNNYLFIWMSFLSAAYVMGNDGHVKVTAFVNLLPERGRIVLRIIMNVIMTVVFFLYISPSIRMLGRLKLSNMMRIPLKYVYMIMPAVFILMVVHILINILDEVFRFLDTKEVKTKEIGGDMCC